MPVVQAAALHRFMSSIFQHAGAPEDHAECVARVLADNDLAGHASHGILRVPKYIAEIRSGELDPTARPSILHETAVLAQVDGQRTFGQVAADFAADLLTEKALAQGVAAVSIVRVNHTGRLAAFTERAAARGVCMFMTKGTDGSPATAPFGGRSAALGTNPVSFSMPNGDRPPVTLDFATSAVAAGKIRVAKAKGEQLPPGSVVTSDGTPTTDPDDYFDGGCLLPFGGHKGYALAVVADVFAGPLTGADEFVGDGRGRGRVARRSGVFMFGVSASAFRSLDSYETATGGLVDRLHDVPPADGFDRVRVPGDVEVEHRQRCIEDGVDVADATWAEVAALASQYGIAAGDFLTD